MPADGVHVVRTGESLYAIGLRYDLAPGELARWNGLGDGELIFPGQRLRLTAPPSSGTPPRSAAAAQKDAESALIRFEWPVKGRIVHSFGSRDGIGKGVDISGNPGDPVFAAAPGRVVYSGDGLIGYGKLIIVKHSERYLSAYGYNNALLVSEGEQVHAGQRIASLGRGPNRRPLLHFEIREYGKPVDPVPLLPAR